MTSTILATANVRITHDKETNLRRFLDLIDEALSKRAEVLVLPEVGLQGYADFAFGFGSPESTEQRSFYAEVAETIPGPSTERIQQALSGTSLHVQIGLAERALNGNLIFNSTAIVGPDGVVGVYRKIHNQFEYPYFAPGEQAPTFDLPVGRAGSLICYDAVFPELSRSLALRGAEMLLMSTGWPLKGHDPDDDHHAFALQTSVQANAFFNQVWFVVSNHCEAGAYSSGVTYYGHSQIVDPRGRVVASSGTEECLVLHEADIKAEVTSARTESFFGHNFLMDRRPEHYADVADTSEYGHARPAPS